MFGEEKNLKNLMDTNSPLPNLPLIKGEEQGGGLSYKKTHKLITALYMVTDIIAKEEPIRNKLRNLGAEIISDTHLIQQNHIGHAPSIDAYSRIAETVSFLNIASAMNFISEMNCTILKKEFFELKLSIQDYIDMKPIWLADFFEDSEFPPRLNEEGVGGGNSKITTSPFGHSSSERRRGNYKGHASLGVQKGSTLLKALSGVKIAGHHSTLSNLKIDHNSAIVFDALKKQRRDNIINIIKTITGRATIKDIKDKARTNSEKFKAIISCSEKTLQRELVSMVKDNVLDKTGEKRWSKYFLKVS